MIPGKVCDWSKLKYLPEKMWREDGDVMDNIRSRRVYL